MAKASQPDQQQRRIFLIDAYSFVYRAYHAMSRERPMSTRTGIPTGATYVFVNMLNKMRKDFQPEFLGACFDIGGSVARETKFADYKATRKEMPDDLRQQIPNIRRALDAYRIPILQQPGFEADDVIGTLAYKAVAQGYEVFVVSSDKDMLQLVGPHICVLNPPKDNLICDAQKVEEILGVPPEQVIDVMALRGDAIDNIPGARGIGDKGSVEIIKRFGTVEKAIEHADEVEKKTYRESLLNNRDEILLSKDLVTIDRNVPIHLDVEAMRAQEPDYEACRVLFSELEFTTLLKEVVGEAKVEEADYRELKSERELAALIKKAAKSGLGIALGSGAAPVPTLHPEESEREEELRAGRNGGSSSSRQGSLLDQMEAPAAAPQPVAATLNLGLSAEPGVAYLYNFGNAVLSAKVAALLADTKIPKAISDYKSAIDLSEDAAIPLAGVAHDVGLYSYLLNPTSSSHGLADIALRRMNVKLAGSLGESADLALRLGTQLRKEVEEENLAEVYATIDLPLVSVLARMEAAGVMIDREELSRISIELERECNSKAREIHALAGQEFNINSPRQLGDVLFNKMGLPVPVKYGKGKQISTAVDVLEELAGEFPVARLVLDYRQLSKLKGTYVDALPQLIHPATGRLHTTFNQTGTATGRLSSTNPNLQNIPIRTEQGRTIRAAFIAAPGNVILSADYSQIELRLLAHFSEDTLLLEAYRRGDDIHQLTASEVLGVPIDDVTAEHRRRAKAVNFGIVYGISPFGLAAQLGIEQKEAKRYIEAYFERYSGVRRFIEQTLEETRQSQKVRTLFGRVRPIPDINSRNANMRGFAERTAVNTPLQGTAADLIKLAMIRLDAEIRRRGLRSNMTLQVHDELVFEVPESEKEEMRTLVREEMESVYRLRVPLAVDLGVGANWRDLA